MAWKALFHSSASSSRKAQRLADQLVRRIAELARRRRIDELDRALGIERQDGVGRAADDGVVARVLALAQDALAPRRDGDVDDLQQATAGRAGRRSGGRRYCAASLRPVWGAQRKDRRDEANG